MGGHSSQCMPSSREQDFAAEGRIHRLQVAQHSGVNHNSRTTSGLKLTLHLLRTLLRPVHTEEAVHLSRAHSMPRQRPPSTQTSSDQDQPHQLAPASRHNPVLAPAGSSICSCLWLWPQCWLSASCCFRVRAANLQAAPSASAVGNPIRSHKRRLRIRKRLLRIRSHKNQNLSTMVCRHLRMRLKMRHQQLIRRRYRQKGSSTRAPRLRACYPWEDFSCTTTTATYDFDQTNSTTRTTARGCFFR